MEIWLDTVDFEVIESAKQMGILYGITTNPTLVAKSEKKLGALLEELLQIQSGPVTAQVIAKDSQNMVQEGQVLHEFSGRVIVKVPVTTEGLKAIHLLKQKDIPVMATAIFEPCQVLLAASAGADYIAPYFSSMLNIGFDGHLKTMHDLLSRYAYNTKLIVASLKSKEQVNSCVELGVDAVTLNKEIFLSIIDNHPETMKKIEKFLIDWQSASLESILPF